MPMLFGRSKQRPYKMNEHYFYHTERDMRFNPDIHHRKSIRLPNYDYSQTGLYFITICTHERLPLFGEIVNGAMNLNQAGVMVDAMWRELANKFPTIQLHEYVVMPNHFHGVVEIVGAERAESIVGAGRAENTCRGRPACLP